MEALSHRAVLRIVVGLMLGMLLPAMTTTVVSTALPAIVSDLGGLSQLSWVVTAYLLAATIAVPIAGKASDLWGRRPAFLIAIGVFTAASIGCAIAMSMGQLIAARALQGAAGGSMMTLVQATIGDVVAPRQRGRYQGYIGAVFALASLAGPLVGGVVVDSASWRWVFWLNVPIGIVAGLVTARYLRLEHVRRPARIDVAGVALVSILATALILISVWGGQDHAWGSPVIVSLGAAALLSLLVLIPVELAVSEPVVPIRLFRMRLVVSAVSISFLGGIALFAPVTLAPTFLQVVLGSSATVSGLMLLPLMGGLTVSSIVSGRLITRWGRYRRFPILGTLGLTVGFVLMGSMDVSSSPLAVAGALIVIGVGMGMTVQVVVLAVQNGVAHRDLGAVTSATAFFRMLGAAIGLALLAAVTNARLVASRIDEVVVDAGFGDGIDLDSVASDPEALAALPPELAGMVRQAVADAVTSGFWVAVPLMACAFLMALVLPHVPLSDRVGGAGAQEGSAAAVPGAGGDVVAGAAPPSSRRPDPE